MAALVTSNKTCVIHPTGTGKSFLIAAVSESYAKVLVLAPNVFVLGQVQSIMTWHKGAEFKTYTALNFNGAEDKYDLIVLDEFHRTGAPEWGEAVKILLQQQPQAKVLGTTATPIRHLDGERDMADEMFDGNVASRMDISEAWSRNILPIPTYVTGLFDFSATTSGTEEAIRESKNLDDAEKRTRLTRLNNLRLDWERSNGMPQIIRKHIDRQARRVIVFCGSVQHLKDMQRTVGEWFRRAGFANVNITSVHCDMPDSQLSAAMKQFESDEGDGLKVMLSVNMLNEGVHVPRVNAVLMLRTTSSRIIYMQQLGRCLTAANTERPVVLDMVDNITCVNVIHSIRDDYNRRVAELREKDPTEEHREFVVYDYRQSITAVISQLTEGIKAYMPWEARMERLEAYCLKTGKFPQWDIDPEEFQNWRMVVRNHENDPRVVALYAQYGISVRNLEVIKALIKKFVAENGRMPRFSRVRDHEEMKLGQKWSKYKVELLKDPEMQELEKNYGFRNVFPPKIDVEAYFDEVERYANETGQLPNLHMSYDDFNHVEKKWKTLRAHHRDHPRMKALIEKYRHDGFTLSQRHVRSKMKKAGYQLGKLVKYQHGDRWSIYYTEETQRDPKLETFATERGFNILSAAVAHPPQ